MTRHIKPFSVWLPSMPVSSADTPAGVLWERLHTVPQFRFSFLIEITIVNYVSMSFLS